MRLIFNLIFVVSVVVLNAQTNTLKFFIPKGYAILDSASGDLNKDGLRDFVLILKNNAEVEMPDTTRPLLILHGTKKKTYTLIERNDYAVLCISCGGVMGDPYGNIVVKNNYFSIEHYGGSNWRWTRIITFKYDVKTKQYILHKDAGDLFNTVDPDKITFQTHRKQDFDKLPFVKYNYNLD